jgi:hypothetical protein
MATCVRILSVAIAVMSIVAFGGARPARADHVENDPQAARSMPASELRCRR